MKIYISQSNTFKKTSITQYGSHFETGVPVTFKYIHNTNSATKLMGKPKKGDGYGRWFEPSAQYVSIIDEIDAIKELPNYVSGTLKFKNPLVIENCRHEWKQQLSESFGNKRGKELSKAIIRAGYDGVVTVDKYGVSEIINLTNFSPSIALYGSQQ